MENKIGAGPVASRCSNCRWVHEADSTAGTSYMGVALCPLHAAAPDLLRRLAHAFYVGGTSKALRPVMAEIKPLLGGL